MQCNTMQHNTIQYNAILNYVFTYVTCTCTFIGAGVAGLASIGTARSMGAVVSAYDVRPVVREQVGNR